MSDRDIHKMKIRVGTLRVTFYIALGIGALAFLYLYQTFLDGSLTKFFTQLDSIFIVIPPFVPALFIFMRLIGAEKKLRGMIEDAGYE